MKLTYAIVAALSLLAGCTNPRYRLADAGPPPRALNAPFPPAPLEARLDSVIAKGGPGAWKEEAFWDEYVVRVGNPGTGVIHFTSARLQDASGAAISPGTDPWQLEEASRTRSDRLSSVGSSIVRNTVPALVIVGAAIEGIKNSGGIFSSGADGIARAMVVAIPVYYLGMWWINSHNRNAVESEFQRRRFEFPLALEPGQARTGSLFFPITAAPHSLRLQWSSGTEQGETALPLDAVLPTGAQDQFHQPPPNATKSAAESK